MKLKTKSSLLIGILTLGTILGFFSLTVEFGSASEVILVEPSGGDDTENIQSAFNSADPGDTVQLAAGQFYTNEIFVVNFQGTFKGTGRYRTKIDVLKGLDDTLEGVAGPAPYLFTFEGGDICISHLVFDISPFMPAEPHEGGESYDLISIILLTGEINSQIEHVTFTGHEGTLVSPLGKGFNVRVGVEYHFGSGKHTIAKCEFNAIWGAISVYGMNVEMKIKSNSIKGGNFGVITMDNLNSNFEISRNYIDTEFIYGIWAWQAGFMAIPTLSKWQITHNTIKVSTLSDGIGLMDFIPEKSLEAVVSSNKITLYDTMWGGIYTMGLQDSKISYNKIRGTGSYGIKCDYTTNCEILGNIISNTQGNGTYFYASSQNLLIGNLISKNGEWGLCMEESNDNRVIANIFFKNTLGNIFDEGNNYYKWNLEL
jgi:parallel beta-helix repeat protein